MSKKLGFIGAGNMATAIIAGIVKGDTFKKENIFASRRSVDKLMELKEAYGINTTTTNIEVAKVADVLFICVKPYLYEKVIKEVRNYISEDTLIVSIAAGITIEAINTWFEKDVKVVKTMPNTPALVGAGITAVCFSENVEDNDKLLTFEILKSFGTYEELDESMFDAFISICGSSPAFIYMLIEAMADAAVMQGLKRDSAYKMISQAVLGSAKMVLDTNEHPGVLKDKVCSPGGSTIAGVTKLEQNGFRSSIIEGVLATAEKAREMKK